MREDDSGPKLSERIVRCQEYCHRYVTTIWRMRHFRSGLATVCAHGCRMRPLSRNSILRVCPLNAWIKGFFKLEASSSLCNATVDRLSLEDKRRMIWKMPPIMNANSIAEKRIHQSAASKTIPQIWNEPGHPANGGLRDIRRITAICQWKRLWVCTYARPASWGWRRLPLQ